MTRRPFSPPRDHHDQPTSPPLPEHSLSSRLKTIAEHCTDCGACMHHCAFLQQHGSPLVIARNIVPQNRAQMQIAFGCSLCGLCTAVCPQRLDPCNLFLDMRRQRVALGEFNKQPYRPLLMYETLGCSRLFSWFDLPYGCTTVFFPGCALPGTRPGATLRMFQYLQEVIPNLGIVLKCCTKPSHDLGYSEVFFANFNPIRMRLLAHGITTVITACPNCSKIFRQYAPEMSVHNVFTIIAGQMGPPEETSRGRGREVVIHDPCPTRDDPSSQEATRNLVQTLGFIPGAIQHQKAQTFCCGEGGAVGFTHPDFTQAWTQKRIAEADGRPIVTTCAGCSALLARSAQTLHLADLLFPDTENQGQPPKVSKPPKTYFNRLLLKFRLYRLLNA